MVVNTVDSFLKNLSIFCFLIFPAALVAGSFAAELSMNTVSIIFLYKDVHNLNNPTLGL